MGKSIALYSSTQYGMNLYYILPGPSRECNRPVVAIFHIHLIWFFNLFEVPISLHLLPLPIPVGTRIPTSFRLEVHSYRQVRIEYQSSRDGRPDKRSARYHIRPTPLAERPAFHSPLCHYLIVIGLFFRLRMFPCRCAFRHPPPSLTTQC